ncbi:IgGFc-binding protein [Nannocystis sp.]|uniref:IgGFc-binding protein n=1 Tax=Nannocystis sp. TaxID=1962667 RepID=UPI0025EBE572|nr:IgGFc-binding protein [Nannocystis sp.]MBK7826963.1 IgGFc-binding protein [Nannocystis sp.]
MSGGLLVAACGDSTGGTAASESAGSTGTNPQTGSSAPTEASGTGFVPTGTESMSDSQASASSSTATVSATDSSTSLTTTGPDTGDTTSPVSLSDSSSGASTGGESSGSTGDPPEEKLCSADLHAVVNGQGELLEMCGPTQGCANAMCIDACDAAAQSQANFGCAFIVPTPPAYPPALPPCFAVFLANTWGYPAKIELKRGGVALDISSAARLATPGVAPKDWPPLPAEGVPADSVGVLFLSSDPNSIMPENQVKLSCPVKPAVDASTVIKGSGRGAAFVISADIPLTAYDILPFGGARSHFPSAELLFPTSVWGLNYVTMAPPAGTHKPPGPMWLQIVGLEDGTKVELQPTADLLAGPNLLGVTAGQIVAFDLGAGEVLQWELPQTPKDPSGSLLLSDKPVGLYAGSRFLRLQPVPAPGGEAAHQQNLAVTALGFEYVAAPYETRRKDLAPEDVEYRFVGVVDDTELVYDPAIPGAPTMLARGQVVDISTKDAFRVRSQDPKHPFALSQLMDTANLPGGSRPGATAPGFGMLLGDEEFVIVLPPAQFLQRYAFFTDPTYATTNLVLTRVKHADVFSPVTIDCLGEIGGWKPVGQDGVFEVTTVDLVRADIGVNGCKNGHHVAESKGPFGLVVWGLDSFSSYAYPAGGSASALSDVIVTPK